MNEETSMRSGEIWVTKFDEEHARKFREAVLGSTRGDPSRPVIVYIDSYGGSVDALASMIETLEEIPNPIITVCIGKAMSCGAILLSHGDVRFCGKHSRVMIHEVSAGAYGDIHDMHADVQEFKRMNEYFIGLLAKNCGYKSYNDFRKLIKEQDGRDRYLNAQQAVEFGIVDAVGTPRISASMMYEINLNPQKIPLKLMKKQEESEAPKSEPPTKTKKKSKGKNTPKNNKRRKNVPR